MEQKQQLNGLDEIRTFLIGKSVEVNTHDLSATISGIIEDVDPCEDGSITFWVGFHNPTHSEDDKIFIRINPDWKPTSRNDLED